MPIDVADFQIQHLGATQSRGIQSRQQGPMLEVKRGIQHGGHFLAAQHGREFPLDFRFGHLLDEPALFQGSRVEELERGIPYLESGPGELPLVDEMQLVVTDLLRSQMLR